MCGCLREGGREGVGGWVGEREIVNVYVGVCVSE